MGDYRHRTTGEVKSQGEWRSLNKNVSFPKVWTQDTLDALQLDPVFETPQPTAGQYQIAVRNGVTQDAKGNWVQAWSVRDMFADDEDSTKAEKEAAYQATLDNAAANSVRDQRNRLLAETDWTQVDDAPVDKAAWAVYRQALRDITSQAEFPHNVVWPTKPE
jgi:transposase-like protein